MSNRTERESIGFIGCPLILDALFPLLESASFGACAVSLDQRILFWNRAAERILGHPSREVVGRRCYEVMGDAGSGGLTPECAAGCSSMRYVRAGLIPPSTQVRMLCSSGERKWVPVTTAVISGVLKGAPLLVYLFEEGGEVEGPATAHLSIRDAHERGNASVTADHGEAHQAPGVTSTLSRRELEVLRLVALGWDTPRIAARLAISRHTVRNHIRNLRNKLGASTKLDAVLRGISLGILSVGRSSK